MQVLRVWGSVAALLLVFAGAPVAEEATTLDVGGVKDISTSSLDDPFDLEFESEPAGYTDPWEEANRAVLGFNRRLDRWVLDPATRGYRKIAPDGVRRAIRRVFANMGSVPTLANDLLQFEPRCAAVTLMRIVANTTVGIGGLFDPADKAGLSEHQADFGQTLAKTGIGSGPYLVLPLLGPTTVRDGTATLVDAAFNPAFWVLGPAQQITYGGGAGLAAREAHFEALMALAASSVDYYAALRNGYYQSRTSRLARQADCSRHGLIAESGQANAWRGASIAVRRRRPFR